MVNNFNLDHVIQFNTGLNERKKRRKRYFSFTQIILLAARSILECSLALVVFIPLTFMKSINFKKLQSNCVIRAKMEEIPAHFKPLRERAKYDKERYFFKSSKLMSEHSSKKYQQK